VREHIFRVRLEVTVRKERSMTAETTARPTSRNKVVPERSLEFVHLDLTALRAYRKVLNAEEHRVSYWRRIIQARLDLIRAHREDGSTIERLQDTFAEERPAQGRLALIAIVPDDDIPPIPDLEAVWTRTIDPADEASRIRLERDLSFAELQLSTYRQALHRRIARATTELIARYREEPTLCLVALPLQRGAA
jgi:hypothetical protein